MCIAGNEGAKFWLSVLAELKPGLQDILIARVNGLKGFPDAINSRLSTNAYLTVHCP